MANLNGFDAREVEPQAALEPIPAGKYLAIITNSEMKATKNGDGSFLELIFQIVEGEYKGRKLWDRLNLDNANPTAVQIARGQLSALCRTVGVMTPRDSVELHNLPLIAVVAVKRRNDNDELVNEIKGYAKKETPVVQPPQATAQTAPWKRT